jgi:hypothetical protein
VHYRDVVWGDFICFIDIIVVLECMFYFFVVVGYCESDTVLRIKSLVLEIMTKFHVTVSIPLGLLRPFLHLKLSYWLEGTKLISDTMFA